jgi:S-DNA-T family DNA segregation ATPase FtsK/SpoIIIE
MKVTAREVAGSAVPATKRSTSQLRVVIGVGGDDVAAVSVELGADGPGFIVAGPPRSGRSTALVTVAQQLTQGGTHVVAIAPRRSPLHDLTAADGPVTLITDLRHAESGMTLGTTDRLAVVIDDAGLLRESALADQVTALLREAPAGTVVVAASTIDDLHTAFRGFLADLRRSRSGLLLDPQSPSDGELFGVRLPRSMCRSGIAGRGVIVCAEALCPVQVAINDAA